LRERGGRYGLTALCIGLGMGCAIVWENLQGRRLDGARQGAEAPASPASERT